MLIYIFPGKHSHEMGPVTARTGEREANQHEITAVSQTEKTDQHDSVMRE